MFDSIALVASLFKNNMCFLWRAEAVETSGVVRPLGIAEIGGAIR